MDTGQARPVDKEGRKDRRKNNLFPSSGQVSIARHPASLVIVPAWAGVGDQTRELCLEGLLEPVAPRVDPAQGEPWFQAKPLVVFLEYGSSNVTRTFKRLDPRT